MLAPQLMLSKKARAIYSLEALGTLTFDIVTKYHFPREEQALSLDVSEKFCVPSYRKNGNKQCHKSGFFLQMA